MVQALNAFVTQLETLGRAEHFDSEGGGRIARVIYCEPYTAHKRVVTALKGTIYPVSQPPAGDTLWQRALPHADPLYPWFYCTDVQVEPFFPAAVRASISKGFVAEVPVGNLGPGLEQYDTIQDALNVTDDFDGASLLDNLTVAEIVKGGITDLGNDQEQLLNTDEKIQQGSFTSRGRCGAKITATYSPLLFMPGMGTLVNTTSLKFDYVDPQWEPLTILNQTGRNLGLMAPTTQYPFDLNSVLKYGLHDSYAMPEVVWRFSIRRLMVPFIPAYTINLYSNKVNAGAVSIGTSLRFPSGTLRMETPEIITRRAPDGQMMHDILLKFLVRRLWDEHWNVGAGAFEKDWITWNEAYCRPAMGWFDFKPGNIPASYYPVVWSADIFPTLGVPHDLFLNDNGGAAGGANHAAITAATGGNIANLTQGLTSAPFQAGFYQNQ